jgi:hypothetical protein
MSFEQFNIVQNECFRGRARYSNDLYRDEGLVVCELYTWVTAWKEISTFRLQARKTTTSG